MPISNKEVAEMPKNHYQLNATESATNLISPPNNPNIPVIRINIGKTRIVFL